MSHAVMPARPSGDASGTATVSGLLVSAPIHTTHGDAPHKTKVALRRPHVRRGGMCLAPAQRHPAWQACKRRPSTHILAQSRTARHASRHATRRAAHPHTYCSMYTSRMHRSSSTSIACVPHAHSHVSRVRRTARERTARDGAYQRERVRRHVRELRPNLADSARRQLCLRSRPLTLAAETCAPKRFCFLVEGVRRGGSNVRRRVLQQTTTNTSCVRAGTTYAAPV